MKRRGFLKILAALVPASQLTSGSEAHASELLLPEPTIDEFRDWADEHVIPAELDRIGFWLSLDGEIYVHSGANFHLEQTGDYAVHYDQYADSPVLKRVNGPFHYEINLSEYISDEDNSLHPGDCVYWAMRMPSNQMQHGQGLITSQSLSVSYDEPVYRESIIKGIGDISVGQWNDEWNSRVFERKVA